MHYSPNANLIQWAFNSPIKHPSMFLDSTPSNWGKFIQKRKEFFLPFDRPSDLKKLLSFKNLFCLVCPLVSLWGFSPSALLILPRCMTEPHTLIPGLGGTLKAAQNPGWRVYSGVVEGSQMGGKPLLLSQLADILAAHEHLKSTGQVYHCLKQCRGHLKDQSVFEPSLPRSLMAAVVTDKHFKLIHNAPGYSDVLLGQTFLPLPSTHHSAQEASQSLCVSSSSM